MPDETEALRRRLELVLQGVSDGVMLLDEKGAISLLNPAAARLLGHSAAALIGRHAHEALCSNDGRPHPADECPLDQTLRDATTHHVRGGEAFRRADGRSVAVEYVSAPVPNGGRASGAVVVFRATDDRERAERALRESEERFRRLAEATLEGVVIHDKGVILDANETFAHMLGYEVRELIGKNVLDLVAPESRDAVTARLRGGFDGAYEATAVLKDGRTLELEVSAHSIPYEGRTVRVATVRDVSERKRAEAKLAEDSVARPLVRKIVQDLVEAGGVAHQILQQVGRKLATETMATDAEGFVKAYGSMGLGELSVEKREEGRFTFVGTDLLEQRPGSRVATCYFTLGFLSEVVSRANHGEPTLGTEIECRSRGSPQCRFIVQVKKAEEGLARRVKELV